MAEQNVRQTAARADRTLPGVPRGAVTTFCAEHGIPRETFDAIKRRALENGQAPALEPRACQPRSSPDRTGDFEAQRATKLGFVGQVDVEANIAADTNEGRPAADENRRLEVVAEPVD